MSGEGYTGHVNGDSAPFQFKIPAATADQYGVVKLGTFRDGINAFTTTTATFVQPAVNANVTVDVEDSRWIAPTQIVFQEAGGYYEVISIPSDTSVTLKNLGYADNAAPSVNVPTGTLTPGGIQGPDSGSTFGNRISTTSGGAAVYYGLDGSDADPANVAGRTVELATTFTKIRAAISPGIYVAPAPVYRVTLYVSTDGGLSYSSTVATVDIDVGTSNKANATFAAVTLAAGSVHLYSVQQLSGGSNTVTRPLSVTFSLQG